MHHQHPSAKLCTTHPHGNSTAQRCSEQNRYKPNITMSYGHVPPLQLVAGNRRPGHVAVLSLVPPSGPSEGSVPGPAFPSPLHSVAPLDCSLRGGSWRQRFMWAVRLWDKPATSGLSSELYPSLLLCCLGPALSCSNLLSSPPSSRLTASSAASVAFGSHGPRRRILGRPCRCGTEGRGGGPACPMPPFGR